MVRCQQANKLGGRSHLVCMIVRGASGLYVLAGTSHTSFWNHGIHIYVCIKREYVVWPKGATKGARSLKASLMVSMQTTCIWGIRKTSWQMVRNDKLWVTILLYVCVILLASQVGFIFSYMFHTSHCCGQYGWRLPSCGKHLPHLLGDNSHSLGHIIVWSVDHSVGPVVMGIT